MIDYASVRYASRNTAYYGGSIEVQDGASPTISNTLITDGDDIGIYVRNGGNAVIHDNVITDVATEGIFFHAFNSGEPGEIRIYDNTVDGSGGEGIKVGMDGPAAFTGYTLAGNTIIGSGGKAIDYLVRSTDPLPPDIDDNDITGNGQNGIFLAGRIADDADWGGGPFVLAGSSGINIASGKTLTLDSGTIVKASSGTSITVSGSLVADGNSGSRVTFTSIADDLAGGDTNGDGTSSSPSPADWGAIVLKSGSSSSVIDYASVRYASRNTAYYGGSIEVQDGASPTISNTLITDGDDIGIYVRNGGNAVIHDNVITDVATEGIFFHAFNSGEPGEIRIYDNTVDGSGGEGIKVGMDGPAAFTGYTLAGNTIIGSGGKAIDYLVRSTDPLPPDIDDNDITGNGQNGIFLAGRIADDADWGGGPFVLAGSSGINIASGKTLTLDSGTIVKASSGTSITVSGSLVADGNSGSRVTFTSIADDLAGGDTNGDGTSTSAGPGSWTGIVYPGSTGGGTLAWTNIRYAGYYGSGSVILSCPCANPPTLYHDRIEQSLGDGLLVSGDPVSPTGYGSGKVAQWVSFRDIGDKAIEKLGNGVLHVPYNDFGSTSGPQPAGDGEEVSSKVDWQPVAGVLDDDWRCQGADSDCPTGSDPISLATGAFTYQHTDLSLPTTGAPLTFARSYNSTNTLSAGLGPGWSTTALMAVAEQENGDVAVFRTDGRQDVFEETTPGNYTPTRGVVGDLEKITGGYTLTENGPSAAKGQAGSRTRNDFSGQRIYEFDDSGRIVAEHLEHGRETTYNYDSNDRLASIEDTTSAQSLDFTYDGQSRITEVEDSAGRSVSFTYSGGYLATATDALGGVTTYDYDAQGRMTSITDPRDVTYITNVYDSQGRVTQQTDGNGNIWDIDYSAGETTVHPPEGGAEVYSYDPNGRMTSKTDALGHETTYSYNADGLINEIDAPGGATWSYTYDSAGNRTSITEPEDGETDFTFDAYRNVTSMTDPRGKEWDYEWNTSGDLETITDPLSNDTSLTYDANGLPATVTDPNGHETGFDYADDGTLSSVTDPLNHTTAYGYDDYGQLTSVTKPGLDPETYERNELGDLVSSTTPEGHETTYDYDENGALTSVTDPLSHTWTIERDDMEHPITYTDPAAEASSIAYDGNLNPTSVTDRNGHETDYTYDDANQLTEVDAPATGARFFGYDARGNREAMTDPNGHETDYTYDLNDRLTEADEPLQTSSTYDYDATGNLTSLTDPNGHETTFTYDALGRRTEMDQPLSKTTTYAYDPVGNLTARTTAEDTLDLTYDNADRLSAISDGTTTLRSFAYDDANRITAATDAQAKTLAFGYDDDGNLTSINDDRGETVARTFDAAGNLSTQTDGRGTLGYAYDELNRLTELTDPNTDTLDFAYDPEGNLTEAALPSGVQTTMSYDNANRLATTVSADGSSNVLQSFDYAYDQVGNRISSTDRNSDATSYDYDALDRLVEFDPPGSTGTAYAYDDAGNRTQAGPKTYDYNALNELTSDSTGTTYAYDDAGRLTNQTNGSDSTDYSYDALDQLTGVDDGSSPIDYTYDGLGRRSERTDGSGTTTAHYGDLTDIATIDTDSGGPVATYIQGPAGLAEQSNGTSTSFPLEDAHGDITTLSDNAGVVSSRQEYEPWGEQTSGPDLEMGWLGAQERWSDPASGSVQMGIRAYAPGLGQFLSEDPVPLTVGEGQSSDRLAYSRDDPINAFDLGGRSPSDVPGEMLSPLDNLWNGAKSLTGTASDNLETSLGWAGDRLHDFSKGVSCTYAGLFLHASSALTLSAAIAVSPVAPEAVVGSLVYLAGGSGLGGTAFDAAHENGIC